MFRETMYTMWPSIRNDGTLHEIIRFLWTYLSDTHYAFYLMLSTITLRFMLIVFYFSLLYFGITRIKKSMYQKIGLRGSYYCWYLLLFSVVFANFGFNNGLMALPSRLLPHSDASLAAPYAFFAVYLLSVIWILIVIFKLVTLAWMNHKIRKSMKHMEHYDDSRGLAEQALMVLRLRRKPTILTADYTDTPISYGVFKKTILLPVNFEEKYTETELYLLLLHEMTHIKHGDTAKLYMIRIFECFLWLTPAIDPFVKSFKRDSEILCDHHVVSLQSEDRDLYGELILKECEYKNPQFGFGFSDSYRGIENRLDALYRYKADKRLKWLAVIPVAVLLICAVSFVFRPDWLIINDQYNSEFEFAVFDVGIGTYMPLMKDDTAKCYTIEKRKLQDFIIFDEEALRTLAKSYAHDGHIQILVSSNNYVVQAGKTAGNGTIAEVVIRTGEPDNNINAMRVDNGAGLTQRTPAEHWFLRIASMV